MIGSDSRIVFTSHAASDSSRWSKVTELLAAYKDRSFFPELRTETAPGAVTSIDDCNKCCGVFYFFLLRD